jgi:hypothetical protein
MTPAEERATVRRWKVLRRLLGGAAWNWPAEGAAAGAGPDGQESEGA